MQKISKKSASTKWHTFREKTQKKEKNDFFESFSKFLIFFQEILELKKGLKNTEKTSKQKWKICTFFEKNSARFPRQKKKGKKKMKNQTMRWDQPWNKVTTRTLVQEHLLAS